MGSDIVTEEKPHVSITITSLLIIFLTTILNCYYSSVFVCSTLLIPPMPPHAWFGVLQLQ
jgi:hypothetical protein